jgi:hypothetical protein
MDVEAPYVWLLWHGDDIHDHTPDATLLGVYSSLERAEARRSEATALPGYRDYPEAFEIARYEIDHDEWVEGFVEVYRGQRAPRPDTQ